MRKLLSTKYSAGAFSAAMLTLRLIFGILMMNHGYGKLKNFNETAAHMPNLFHMGSGFTTALVIFAEFFCALFIILGLFTRLATIPIIICMCYALFVTHNAEVFGKGEMATLYLGAFLVLLFVGPGRVSVDSMIGK
ncbi:MAG: DoxX family protein [Ferruginibacter sp.]|nr:DoxX family protein [Ferruginibacter sp.]